MPSRKERLIEFKKEMIATAACRLFSASCYEDVSVDNIAQEAEIGKGTLYYYFKSKEEILAFVIYRGLNELLEKMQQPTSQEGDLLDNLAIMIDLQYDYYLQYNPLFFSLLRCESNGKIADELLDPIKKKNSEKHQLLLSLLEKGMAEGRIKSGSADHLAWGMGYAIKGFGLMGMENKCQDQGDNNLQLLKSMVLTGILVREEKMNG